MSLGKKQSNMVSIGLFAGVRYPLKSRCAYFDPGEFPTMDGLCVEDKAF